MLRSCLQSISQPVLFHEAELIHCTFLESGSRFSFPLLYCGLLTPHPPLISLSDSLISLSSLAAFLFHSDIFACSSAHSDSLFFFFLFFLLIFPPLFNPLILMPFHPHSVLTFPWPFQCSFLHYSICLPCATPMPKIWYNLGWGENAKYLTHWEGLRLRDIREVV